MKKNNIFFLTLVSLFLMFGMFTIIRTEKDISYKENRYLQKFPHLTISNFLNGGYQGYLESALTDQFVGGETIKDMMHKVFNQFTIPKSGIFCENKYFHFGDYYTYNCDEVFIAGYTELDSELEKELDLRIKMYSELNDYIDTYYYFISSSAVFNFEKNEYSFPFLDKLKEMSGKYHLSAFTFDNYEDYKKYFYNTDHHWNYLASYKGYIDIMKMFDSSIKVLEPIDEVTFDFSFLGSSSRILDFKEFNDKFTVYKFNIPFHVDYINKEEIGYGKQEKYFNREYVTETYTNHYGEFYGWDHGELVFDFNNKKLDNLLILSNSFSNPINELIASHFNKTFVIDLRHYEKTFGEKFNIKEYIKANKVDKVLVLGDYEYFSFPEFVFDMEG